MRLVAPFAPGGSTDVLTRITAAQLNNRWKQSIVVDNRVGASGRIGAEYVAKQANPDGYTLLVAGAPHAIGMSLFRKNNYDLAKDLAGASGLLTGGGPLGSEGGEGWHYMYLFSQALTIGGGTWAVQRNIVAEKVLGLPHDVDVEVGKSWREARQVGSAP